MSDTIDFHRITLQDRDQILYYLQKNTYMSCDYSFSNLYNWGFYYQTEVAFHKDMMVVRFITEEGERPAYLMPIGEGWLTEVLEDMEQAMQQDGYRMTLMSVPEEGVKLLESTYPEQLHILSDRDYSDYIYLREKMVSLSGKKLQSKRNHINKFTRNYPDYRYEEINDQNVDLCIDLENRWYDSNNQIDELNEERRMVLTALKEREAIGLQGGCIIVDEKVVAFSLGMPITANCFGIHIEKADTDYDGSFAIINKEFATRIPEQYTYVNREEDLGIEGLRKAKLSYYPEIMLTKHTVMLSYEEE